MAFRVFSYCFKVWVTAVLIGTVLLVTLTYVFSRTHPHREDLKYVGLLLMNGSLFSLPSLLLSWIGAFFINHSSRSQRAKRLWIVVLAAPLTLLPFIFVEQGELEYDWQPICWIAGLYYLVTAAAIFFYPLPESSTAHP
jgi:hypothetical protein